MLYMYEYIMTSPAEILEAQFVKASQDVQQLTYRPTDASLLDLYALYKQATVGDNNTPSPSFLNFKGQAKWKAWNNVKGMTKQDAMVKYILLVKSLLEK